MLSDVQISHYADQGYVVLEGFKSEADLAGLRARALQLVDAFDPDQQRSIFTTREQARVSDAYFLDSAERISFFFEEDAFTERGELRQAKALSINKIGHALHDLDPLFADFSHGAQLHAVAQALGLEQPQIWQSMYIFKQPGIGGEVGWHQDATFLHTEPLSVTTFWFALEDATLDNGCLWVQPGGHRSPLRQRFVREEAQVQMHTLDTTPWPDQHSAVALPVKAGTLVCFHGLLPHYSAPNRSAVSRHAYTLHVTDARTTYAANNWLQRPTLGMRGFL